ncbi:phenylalanine--tRNA ligase subunit beta [Glaciihabitans arcticus]|uniref:Phenylalanine--tRNA ligase beta subunit n=1 Tax=Glaciihabitans arcticus TaxID=2668039 RepID=A0A4Q9GUA6_9MICO|nr:phenylalanine--tRNA ligase subunit beta [Glaciihabitans arcticus]TBN56143.1 phenylalanine--tRNA ligase subunit beta [Glaciihabitans arcticus]
MRVPLSWLGEYVDLPETATLDHVHEALVKVGFEEEDVHGFDLTGPVVVGRVLAFDPEPQSNGKTINWCQVDVGEGIPRGIVCGAHNFSVGDKVVVSLPGAVLPGPFPIAARKTYGHVSDGMIASARELGLGEEHDGILLLSSLGLDPEVGVDAIALLGLDDAAVEINVTPDRGYAFSLRGVAREYSHSTGAAFRDPAAAVTITEASGFPVVVTDDAPIRGERGASVFETRVVRNIDATRPTPPWMVARLALAGVRSISLPVDITNYVMFELGQPTHGYDLDTLTGGITVRRATAGETFETLDGKQRTLSAEDLLITDDSGPIGLAGVMGGAKTEITPTTKNVLVEAANFDPVSIARSARRHRLPSEASKRFERGVDPQVAAAAASRVAELLVQLAGGTLDTLGSSWNESVPADATLLRDGYAASLIGVDYTAEEERTALEMIGATVEDADGGLSVTPPSWRPDLSDAPTFVEEIARIVGYDRIPSVLPVAPPGRGLTRTQRQRRDAARALAAGGLTEVLAYPFLTQKAADLFGAGEPLMRLANALDSEAPFMRRSLLPGLVEIARRNLGRGLTDLALYEIGHVFLPASGATYGSGPLPVGNAHPGGDVLSALDAGIPKQPWHVAALFTGDTVSKQPGQPVVASGLVDALDTARLLAAALAVDLRFAQGSHESLHPGRTAEVFVGDRSVGFAGELLPSIADDLDLPRVVALLELDLDAMMALAATEVAPTPIVSMPAATQDLSLVVPSDVPAAEVLATVVEGAGDLLEDARLVDDYRGQGVAEGSKSLTFALRFRAPDRTLTAAEASEAKNGAVALATSRFAATLRE